MVPSPTGSETSSYKDHVVDRLNIRLKMAVVFKVHLKNKPIGNLNTNFIELISKYKSSHKDFAFTTTRILYYINIINIHIHI